MHEQDIAILKALVPMAWADGHFADREKETLDALLDAFAADDAEKEMIRAYASQKRTLDDIQMQDLSADDRRMVLQHAVILSYVDGHQGAEEKTLLDQMIAKMKIPADEANAIVAAATVRAKELLKLLA